MASVWAAEPSSKPTTDNKDVITEIVTQLVISIALGLSAFLGFCVSLLCLTDVSVANIHHRVVLKATMERTLCGKEETE